MGVPLCPAWLSLFMRRGETDGQIFFNHHNEGIHMSEQTTHTTTDTVDPQFLGPEAGQQAGVGEPIYGMTATYSPDDNKLRLTSASRLDRATYDRVKEAGFRWAPKLEQFIAPMWTPVRADLCVELAGEIGDEDGSLIDRAEDRAERFEGYQESRADEAERASEQVRRIADGIPFGQPILVGHHSERHARKDAERITNGMRKAVKAFETAEYWKHRAAAAIRHAKYKERADVRARRIKTIEADKRKQERVIAEAQTHLKSWQREGLTMEQALHVSNFSYMSRCFTLAEFPRNPPASQHEGAMGLWSALSDGVITVEQAQAICLRNYPATIQWAQRWVDHYENRLAYERAMLADAGGTVADQIGPQKGGAVRCWVGRGSWVYIQKVNKISVTVLDNWGNGGKNFTRTVEFDQLRAIMSADQVAQARTDGLLVELQDKTGFMLRAAPTDEAQEETTDERNARLHAEHMTACKPAAPNADIEAMRATLKAGVQVVSAPQLFPTPPALAARMVHRAGLAVGMRVLEPSAGTGRVLEAFPGVMPFGPNRQTALQVVAVELNTALAANLDRSGLAGVVRCSDFLECGADELGGLFDRVVMNPPFGAGADIQHITHALTMLKPGGRLVALCANGPRQNATLRPLVDASEGDWEDLPADSFKAEGTGVSVALITLYA